MPTAAATTPDSKAPSSLDALMKTISTAVTRPRSSFGVTSAIVVERMLTLIMSTNPATASAASESGSHSDSPKTTMQTPKRATTTSSVGPAEFRNGRRVSISAASSAPTAGAVRSAPRPTGPTCRIERANTGASAIAPPNSTAKRSSRIAPSTIGLLRRKLTPSIRLCQPGAPLPGARAAGRLCSASTQPSPPTNNPADRA